MKLARTYLEMGMLDEAIASLQTAVAFAAQRFEAASAARPRLQGARRHGAGDRMARARRRSAGADGRRGTRPRSTISACCSRRGRDRAGAGGVPRAAGRCGRLSRRRRPHRPPRARADRRLTSPSSRRCSSPRTSSKPGSSSSWRPGRASGIATSSAVDPGARRIAGAAPSPAARCRASASITVLAGLAELGGAVRGAAASQPLPERPSSAAPIADGGSAAIPSSAWSTRSAGSCPIRLTTVSSRLVALAAARRRRSRPGPRARSRRSASLFADPAHRAGASAGRRALSGQRPPRRRAAAARRRASPTRLR